MYISTLKIFYVMDYFSFATHAFSSMMCHVKFDKVRSFIHSIIYLVMQVTTIYVNKYADVDL